ncbi:MAG: ABC transporter ATP-binding protein [Candidatus Cloacimonetes bacterium]|nr:ABC transporter ATP-binding protein [Candidatus Cloacimonadota bacterium]
MSLLNIQQLFFKYHQTDDWLFQDLNLSAENGEVIVIHGLNGSGKSTLLSLLCGIIPKEIKGVKDGVISINDIDIDGLSLPELSPLVSMVFQEPEMQLSFPIVEQELAFGPENVMVKEHEICQRIQRISDLLHISHLLKSDIASLSYGQKKLITIAALYTLSPDIILLDEPEDGLSADSIGSIRDCIMQYKQEKLTIISSTTHTFDDISDRIITIS